MKKFLKILLLVILAALLAFVIWQWKNITAVAHFLTTDRQTVTQELTQVREQHRKELEEVYDVHVAPPSEEQSQQLLDGEKQPEEIKQEMDLLIPEQTEEKNPENANSIVEKYTKLLYAYRIDLMAQLGVLKQEMLDKWHGLKKEERTAEKKTQLVVEGIGKCYDLSIESDAHVKAILEDCKKELEAIGADTAVTKTLWNQYLEEKETEKAYYMNKYLNQE